MNLTGRGYKFPKGNVPWNKGVKGWTQGTNAGYKKGHPQFNHWLGKKHTLESRLKMSLSLRGKAKSPKAYSFQAGDKHPNWKGGKATCVDCGKLLSTYKVKRCISCLAKYRIGNNSPNWKGGVSKNVHSPGEKKYKLWRKSVFERDNFRCRIDECCDGYVQAHHILPWRDFPKLRYNINNGITLCLAHHPRKRAEEKRLIPFFMDLVSVSNNTH